MTATIDAVRIHTSARYCCARVEPTPEHIAFALAEGPVLGLSLRRSVVIRSVR
jgi:hypothetical protein